jgi:ABC-2 type transport system ATP-binding protein
VSTGPAIEVDGLSKHYGDLKAVDAISFSIPRGVICGFIGPNGSGKTTTIRMLLGLIRPSAGHAQVLGAPVAHPERYLDKVGALIEGPAFYPPLSGADNLRVLARLGGHDTDIVPGLIDRVGLSGRGDDKFKSYSLGMKQRLGIAAALLPDPELLILDEPTNGLDPAGIQEVRALLRDLANAGMTIFVSSHLLSELEMISDHLVILRVGHVMFSGTKSALLDAQQPVIIARPERGDQVQALANIARAIHDDVQVSGGEVRLVAHGHLATELNRRAFDAGIVLSSLHTARPNLEETFFDMTGQVSHP